MSFKNTWERFVADWKTFANIALGILVTYMIMVAVSICAGLSMAVSVLMSVPDLEYLEYYMEDPTYLLPLMGQFGFLFVLLMIAGVVVGALMMGGLMGSLVAYRRGEAISVPLFFTLGRRYWGRMLAIIGLATLINVTPLLLMFLPVLAILVSVLATPLVVLYCVYYPAYLVVAEEKSVVQAFGASFKALARDVKEAAVGAGILLLMYLALGLVSGLFVFIPLVGAVATFALGCLGATVIADYFIDRFEAKIRPLLNG